MATATRNRTRPEIEIPPTLEGLRPYRLTVRQFEKMMEAGILNEDARVELLGGVLVEQMTKNAPHDFSVGRLAAVLTALLSPDWIVREEKAVIFGDNWRPEPDIAVASGPLDRYRTGQPRAADLSLVIEVSESSYVSDRRTKWHGYAAAGIPVYWIVNLSNRVVEVYSTPSGRGKTAKYRESATFGPGELVPVMIEGREVGKVAVDVFMP